MSKEAMKLALEALEDFEDAIRYDNEQDDIGARVCCGVLSYNPHTKDCKSVKAITALREALEAQPAPAQQQEPLIPFLHGCKWCGKTDGCDHEQPAQRKPLPDFSPIFSGIKENT